MFLSKVKAVYYLYYTNPSTGKLTRTSTKESKRKDAVNFWKNFEIKKPIQNSTVQTLTDLKSELTRYAENHFSKSTQVIYKRVLTRLIETVGNKSLSDLSINDIEKYKNVRLLTVNKTSINIEIRTLKGMLNHAVKWEYIPKSPAKEIRQLSVGQKERLCFDPNEIKLLLDSIQDIKFRNLVIFALYTGLRLDEILHIQLRDINLAERSITVRNKPNFKTKSGKIRVIPISNNLYSTLKEIIKEKLDGEIYLFANPYGGVYDKCAISRKFKRYLRKAGLPEKYHFHALRHTCLTNLAKRKVSLYHLKCIAGHADIKTTEIYLHSIVDDLREAVDSTNINYL